MLNLKRRLDRVRPEFPDYVNVFDAPGHVQSFEEFVKHKISRLIAFVLLRLIIPRHPDITFRKLPKTNQSPLHFVMFCRHAFNSVINPSTDRCVASGNVDQFLPGFQRFQHTEGCLHNSARTSRALPR
jgi:hypothetical protein